MAIFIQYHYRLLHFFPNSSKIGALYTDKMSLTVDQIIMKVTHKVFPITNGESYYQRIHDMWSLLYGNAFTISAKIGGGNHGHVRIVMWDKLYEIICPTPYNSPVDLGITTQVPEQTTTSVCLQLQEYHTEACRVHENNNNMGAALKTVVIKSVDSKYIIDLHNIFTGYMGSLTKDIMNCLMARYRKVIAADTKEKKKPLNNPWTRHSRLICSSS